MSTLILAALWAIVLLPPLIRRVFEGSSRPARSVTSPLARIGRSSEAGSPVGRSTSPALAAPAPPITAGLVPRNRTEAEMRRRAILAGLVALAVLSLLLVPAIGDPAFYLHAVIDSVAAAFGYLMWQRNQRADERRTKVRQLPLHPPVARSASLVPAQRRVS